MDSLVAWDPGPYSGQKVKKKKRQSVSKASRTFYSVFAIFPHSRAWSQANSQWKNTLIKIAELCIQEMLVDTCSRVTLCPTGPPVSPPAPQAYHQSKITQSTVWQPKCNSKFFGGNCMASRVLWSRDNSKAEIVSISWWVVWSIKLNLLSSPQFWQFWNIEKRKMEKTTLKRESRLAKLNEVKMNGSEKKQTAKQAAKFLVSTTTFSL